MQIYWDQRKLLLKKRVQLPADVLVTATRAAISLFCNTNMATVTRHVRGTQQEYSSKPLKHSIVERILVFKR